MAYNFPRTLSLISTKTGDNSATFLEFTSAITTNFSTYYVEIRNLLPATNNVTLALTYSTNNGSTYLSTNYAYVCHNVTSAPASSDIGGESAASCIICDALSNAASAGLSADIYLYGVDGALPMLYKGQGSHYNQASNYNGIQFTGQNFGTTAVTAIKWTLSSGNIVSGTIKLFGVTE